MQAQTFTASTAVLNNCEQAGTYTVEIAPPLIIVHRDAARRTFRITAAKQAYSTASMQAVQYDCGQAVIVVYSRKLKQKSYITFIEVYVKEGTLLLTK